MHQLGNLALICAKRSDVVLVTSSYFIIVEIRNKEKISNLIHELNFGAYAPQKKE